MSRCCLQDPVPIVASTLTCMATCSLVYTEVCHAARKSRLMPRAGIPVIAWGVASTIALGLFVAQTPACE